MNVKFITTTSSKLSTIPITNGQLIYLSDNNVTYYDMNNKREIITSIRIVSSLPSTSSAQEGVIYGVVNRDGKLDASVWDKASKAFRAFSGGIVTSLSASSVIYDNSISGLASTEVQSAVDEIGTIALNAANLVTTYENRIKALEELASIALTTEGR